MTILLFYIHNWGQGQVHNESENIALFPNTLVGLSFLFHVNQLCFCQYEMHHILNDTLDHFYIMI